MRSCVCRAAQTACVALTVLLAACGGGGSTDSGPFLSVSTTTVTITAFRNGATPPAQNVGVSVGGGTVFVGISSITGTGFSVSFQITGQASGAITITPAAPTMNVGTYNGTITVRGCPDPSCSSGDVPGSPRVISVAYTIQPEAISAIPPSLNFIQLEGSNAPAPVTLTLSDVTNAHYTWNASIFYNIGYDWLRLNGGREASGPSLPASPSVDVVTQTSVGTYRAQIRVSGNGNVTWVPVTYVVRRALVMSPSSLSFDIGNTPTDLTRQISLDAFPGVSWTAQSSAPWLSLTPTSGSSSASITASLVETETEAKNNGLYFATVTLTPSVGSTEVVPVTLKIARTQVNAVVPYVAIANTQDEVVIHGDHLDQVNISGVKFGNVPATSFSLVSNSEIRAVHPGLTPGNYPVQLETNLGAPRSLAYGLVAVLPQSYAAATIAYPNAQTKRPLDIIYDAERQALLVGVAYPTPGSSGEIFRYPFTDSAWATSPTSGSVAKFRDFALGLDGKQLIVASDFAVQQLDAVALTTGTIAPSVFTAVFFNGIAMANDGNAVLPTGYAPIERGATAPWNYLIRENQYLLGPGGIGIVRGIPGSSADGSLVILSHASPDLTSTYIGQYESRRGWFSFIMSQVPGLPLTWPRTSIRPKLDRKATRLVLNGYIVIKNSDYSHWSLLPPVAPEALAAVALSPDGTRAYQYVSGTLLRTFDVSSSDQGVSEIGAGTVLASDPGANPVMTVSPDGRTLFIAGANGIVVVPAP